jgi:hypothetical protein
MRSSIVVNWENTIVFSPVGSPSSSVRASISSSNLSNLRILAESGGKFESFSFDSDLRWARRVSSTQLWQ